MLRLLVYGEAARGGLLGVSRRQFCVLLLETDTVKAAAGIGLPAHLERSGKEDFFIAISGSAPRFIQCAGIQSPGLTSAPAVAELLCELLERAGVKLLKKNTPPVLPEKVPAVRELAPEQVDELFRKDPAWTNIICRCEKVSEAEIRIAVRRGHTTLDGVKLATRAGMGRCQSGFCTLEIMKIIAEETNTPLIEVVKREKSGNIVSGILGELE